MPFYGHPKSQNLKSYNVFFPKTQTLGLGSKPGDTEMSYLMIIPLNGDPIEVIV